MATERLYYVDYLRAFAMLFGILVHATTVADYGSLEIIPFISNNFRMGTFFAISGFFAVMLIDRRGASLFVSSRSQAIGIPLLSGLLLLNPVTLLLVFRHHNPGSDLSWGEVLSAAMGGEGEFFGAVVWHLHLWFLVSLLVYALVAPVALRAIDAVRTKAAIRRAASLVPPWLRPVAVAIAVAVAVLAARAAFSLILKPLDAPWIVRATMSYFPYYLLGMILYRESALWRSLHRIDPPLLALVALLWAASAFGMVSEHAQGVFGLFRREINVCAAFFALLFVFRFAFNRPSRVGSELTGAVYTIYIFHYLTIYLLVAVFGGVIDPSSHYAYWLIVAATATLCYLAHRLLVTRSGVLMFMFNGKKAGAS